jgi:hypothetical protein
VSSLRRCSLIVIVGALCLAAVTGCRGSAAGPPGSGGSVADKAYTALQPHAGDLVYSVDVNESTPSIWERVYALEKSDPTLKVASGHLASGNPDISFTFSDGSTLTFKPGTDGTSLAATAITRP